jgi:hypothetical protein
MNQTACALPKDFDIVNLQNSRWPWPMQTPRASRRGLEEARKRKRRTHRPTAEEMKKTVNDEASEIDTVKRILHLLPLTCGIVSLAELHHRCAESQAL